MRKLSLTLAIGFLLCSFGFTGIKDSVFPYQSIQQSIKRGKEVYTLHCQNCHMEDGKGLPDVNPPLAKADYLKKPAKHLIEIMLKGQTGEITVNGVKYNGSMLAYDYLTNEQVADVLNYIRNSWGNKIVGTITAAMVKQGRN